MAERVLIKEPKISRLLFTDTRSAWFWALVRVYAGYSWLTAGLHKIGASSWTGEDAGSSVQGFVTASLAKSGGEHLDVQGWYAWFLENLVLPNADIFSYLVAYGETLVGVALILGLFTGIASFFGMFMNTNFLLAGTVSTNPILFILSIGLLLAWKVAGYIGLDRWVLPAVGTPWQTDVNLK